MTDVFAVLGANGELLPYSHLRDGWRAVPGFTLDRPAPSIGSLLDMMQFTSIRQLWIHGDGLTWLPVRKNDAGWFLRSHGWDVRGSSETELAWWWRARRDGDSLQIAIPAWNQGAGYWGCWEHCPTPAQLGAELHRFAEAVGTLPVAGPGRTGESILRKLRPYLLPAPMPPPAVERPQERDLVWIRREPPTGRYLHSFDRAGQYLSVMGGLELGVGAPVQRRRPDTRGKLPPGYWLVTGGFPPDNGLPNPCEWAKPGKEAWITTPTLRLILDAGAEPIVIESWTWPEAGRTLEPLYKRLMNARKTLRSGAAFDAVKAIYTQMIGRFESSAWDRNGDPFWRPDWRQQIIAASRCNFWRALAQLRASHGLSPVACYVDEVVYESNSPEPMDCLPTEATDRLGAFRHTATGEAAQLRRYWDARRAPNLVGMLAELKS